MPTVTTVDALSVVEKLESDFVKNVKAGNAKKLVAGFYAADAHFYPNHAPAAIGTAQILRACQDMFDLGVSGIQLEATGAHQEGNTIWATGTYEQTMTPPGTRQQVTDVGKYVSVFRRQANGDWRCVADIFNTDLPPNDRHDSN